MDYIKKYWGVIALFIITVGIVAINYKSGFYILGNDNYSPELNPKLSLTRSILNPAWRSYRVLGISSDSEQADIFRTLFFYFLQFIFPAWLTSQIYVFLAFMAAAFGMGFLAKELVPFQDERRKQEMFLLSAIIYITTLLTVWIFLSPLKVFLAGYAFLPLLLFSILKLYRQFSFRHLFLLLVSLAFFTTSSMVATTFIVEAGVIVLFFFYLFVSEKRRLVQFVLIGFLVFASQLFWALPFTNYVKSNSAFLQTSYINRVLTPQLIVGETKYNTPLNISRFYSGWVETKNEDGTYQFPFSEWYQTSPFALVISFIPTALALFGIAYCLYTKRKKVLFFLGVGLVGWFLIKGTNPPFGFLFSFLQNTIPLFKQVFRWQSSKVFPLLLIPIALFASIGGVAIAEKIHKKMRVVAIFLLVGIQLLYVFPFLVGHLIDSTNYVAVPNEYYKLQAFIEKENLAQERIYVAPEANTLYFRNYSWGFFGSSFLNYLLPNPLIEKALVTGSDENEGAQTVLQSAYNAKNPTAFVKTLRLYETPLVLLDTSASRNHNGYPYDFEIAKVVLEENPSLEKIWSSNFLTLYQLKNIISETTAEVVYPNHKWSFVNMLKAAPSSSGSYVSSDALLFSGVIYPLALDFSDIEEHDQSFSLKHTYTGSDTRYVASVKPRDVVDVPTQVWIENKHLLLQPVFIGFERKRAGDTQQIAFGPPTITSEIADATRYISIHRTVVPVEDLVKEKWSISEKFAIATENVKVWNQQFVVAKVPAHYQEKISVPILKESIVNIHFSASSSVDMPFIICAYSVSEGICLNTDNTTYLSQIPKTIDLTLGKTMVSSDTLELYLQPKNPNKNGIISLENLEISLYQEAKTLQFKPNIQTDAYEEQLILDLKKDDVLSVVVPKLKGIQSYHLDPKNIVLPDLDHGSCTAVTKDRFINYEAPHGLVFNSKNCFDQLIVKIPRVSSTGLGLLYYKGENNSGIPLIISLNEAKNRYKDVSNIFNFEKSTQKLEFVELPLETRSYELSIYSYSVSDEISRNTLSALSFQFIPGSWFSMKLVPETGVSEVSLQNLKPKSDLKDTAKYTGVAEITGVYGIPQSIAPNWKISEVGDVSSVRINGWKQGWYIKSPQSVSVEFSSNKLATLGWAIYLISFGLGVIGILIKNKRRKGGQAKSVL